jgi:hypothetical protein
MKNFLKILFVFTFCFAACAKEDRGDLVMPPPVKKQSTVPLQGLQNNSKMTLPSNGAIAMPGVNPMQMGQGAQFSKMLGDCRLKEDIAPIHIEPSKQHWWYIIGVVFLLILFIWHYLRRRKKEVIIPDYELAVAKLEALTPDLDNCSSDEFAYLVSGIIREFLEKHFKIYVTHKTSEEFFELLRGGKVPELKAYSANLENLFSIFDITKYAGHKLTLQEKKEVLTGIITFIKDLISYEETITQDEEKNLNKKEGE